MGSEGLMQLCNILTGESTKPLAPAAQTLWQLIADSEHRSMPGGSEQDKVVDSILTLGGHKGAVHILQIEDRDVVEQGCMLIASLASHNDHAAVSESIF